MATDITSMDALHWQPRLDDEGAVVEGLADIAQAIRIILLTRKGQDPHRPEFGSDIWRHVDRPIPSARPDIIMETLDAIERWEPRAEVIQVQVEPAYARLTVRVLWRPAGAVGEAVQITEISP